jgi:hypothetical protein
MKRNRPALWYDKKGAPRSEPFKLTLSQIGRDLIEVDQRETRASDAEIREQHNFVEALSVKEDRIASLLAWRIKHDNFAWLPKVLSKITEKARFLRKLSDALDALEGKGKFGPKPGTLNVVTSYFAAVDHLHDIHFGKGEGLYLPGEFDIDPTFPTLAELKEQFVQLFGEQLLPADWTIRKTVKRLKLPLREGTRGRPRKIAPRKRA